MQAYLKTYNVAFVVHDVRITVKISYERRLYAIVTSLVYHDRLQYAPIPEQLKPLNSNAVLGDDNATIVWPVSQHDYTMSQKTVQNRFCQNFVKFPLVLIIFGRNWQRG